MDYYLKSRQILREEMKRRGITIDELVVRLTAIGSPELPRSLTEKISRGRFQMAFFMQCMTAMGVESLTLLCPSIKEAQESGPPEITRDRPRVFVDIPRPEKAIYSGRQHKPKDGVVKAGARTWTPKTEATTKPPAKRKAA